GLARLMPTTHLTMLISTAAIAGFPLTAGFFSKDAILHDGYLMPFVPFWLRVTVVTLAYGAALLTAIYMFRLYYLTFGGTYRGVPPAPHQGHGHHADHGHGEATESPAAMTIPLQVLALLAVVSGFLLFTPVYTPFEHYLAPVVHENMALAAATRQGLYGEAAYAAAGLPAPGVVAEETAEAAHTDDPDDTRALSSEDEHGEAGAHGTDLLPKATWGNDLPFYLVSTIIALIGISLAKGIWGTDPAKTQLWKRRYAGLHALASRAFRVDELYHRGIVVPGMSLFHNLWRGMDEGMIDDTLVEGTARGTGVLARGLRVVQSGYLRSYATYIVLGVVVMFIITVASLGRG
ncbi:MAG TPA: proton-conducting transporter membrane subunit, partial [bacterium]|nr:proton-conducting transporter membrane subunit [bacterium]